MPKLHRVPSGPRPKLELKPAFRPKPKPKPPYVSQAKPPLTHEEMLAELRELSVEPFVKQLGQFLAAAPGREALAEFAAAKPDQWASAVKSLAGLAGYADKSEIKVAGIIGHVHAMSDAQLLDCMRQLLEDKPIDVTPELTSNRRN